MCFFYKILIKKESLTGYELSEKLYELGIEDEKTNEVKGKCILKANKTYVMFEITDKKDRN